MLNSVEFLSNSNGYEIMINAGKKINIEKKIISDNKIIIKLKNTTTNGSAKTIYNNANNIKNVIIKPINSDLLIEVNGNNIAKGNILLNNQPIKEHQNNCNIQTILAILLVTITGIIAKIKISKRKKLSVIIQKSKEDMENKILKVAFDRRQGLVAQGTGMQQTFRNKTISQYNVRRVDFNNEYGTELKVKV